MLLAWIVGIAPLVGWLLWWWNDIWYVLPLEIRSSSGDAKLPPGYMGIPCLGEMLTFLWYFKIVRRPDEYINSKRHKYGDGVEMFRSHLFGSPAVIAWGPSINKFILQTEPSFILDWPTTELVGRTALVSVHGNAHARLRSFVTKAINQPNALRQISIVVQPRLIMALQSWAHKERITVYTEVKRVTFENVIKYFATFEPGPLLETLNKLFAAMVKGVRSYPLNFPGTTYHHALKCRKKAVAIFREELEKRKKSQENKNDIMGGLMQMKDEEGKPLRDTEVLDNIVSLIVGGYESTSLAIMWAFYYLAKYPNVLEKLREENIGLSKKKDGKFITVQDISQLKYTNKVVEETIRLANIASVAFRTATKDIEYKGYKIPKGWKAMCWLRYIHTNPENFDDPMCFNPDRWDEPARPGTYLVFGAGQRICAGNMLARLQLAIMLHHLAVGYKWKLVNPNAPIIYLSHQKPADGVEIFISKI